MGAPTPASDARGALAREAYITYQVAMHGPTSVPDWEILNPEQREPWAEVADRIVQISWGDRSPLELAAALVKEWRDLVEGTVPVTPHMMAAARAVGRCAEQLEQALGLDGDS